MGFNNQGSEALMRRIIALRELNMWPSIPVGANVGKSKITPLEEAGEDYRTSIERLQGLVDYFTVNVSSPNTPGLRDLQSADNFKKLDAAMPAAKGTPVFVNFAPDMNAEDLTEAIDAVIDCGAAGIIGTNTTNKRPYGTDKYGETGGLSGDPLWNLAREQIQLILDATDKRVPVIGVGGVNSPERAQTLLNMGCKAVQLYSALIYKGPWLISEMNRSLKSILKLLRSSDDVDSPSPWCHARHLNLPYESRRHWPHPYQCAFPRHTLVTPEPTHHQTPDLDHWN